MNNIKAQQQEQRRHKKYNATRHGVPEKELKASTKRESRGGANGIGAIHRPRANPKGASERALVFVLTRGLKP